MDKDLRFIEEYCNDEETKSINERLLALYRRWYNMWYEGKERNYAEIPLNRPALLTCTDAYLNNRVMMFGQEAHDETSFLKDFQKELDEFFVSESYHYEKMIRFDVKGIKRDFLKTRKVCAGVNPNERFKDNEPEYRRFTSVLVNNLNKVSYMGKHTPVDNQLKDIYSDFEFDGIIGNIYFHETRILKPEKLIFLTGSYTNHLERDFGKEVADSLRDSWKTLYLGNNGEHRTISQVGEVEYAGRTMKYIYGYHPSAHLSANDRNNYNESIKAFVNAL